jgi:hypothetical protein
MANIISNLYKKDFYAWTVKNAELLRKKEFNNLDIENIAEEIESMGRGERRQIISRLVILISHLLKWQYQEERRGNSWLLTIKEQRRQLSKLLEENPSLKNKIEHDFKEAYEDAVLITSRDTGILEYDFPNTCIFNLQQCLDIGFFPEN